MGRQEKEGKGIDAGPGLDEDDEQRCKELTNYVFVQSLCKFNRQEISSLDAVRLPRGETTPIPFSESTVGAIDG